MRRRSEFKRHFAVRQQAKRVCSPDQACLSTAHRRHNAPLLSVKLHAALALLVSERRSRAVLPRSQEVPVVPAPFQQLRISRVVVDPTARGRGIDGAMMREALAVALGLGLLVGL